MNEIVNASLDTRREFNPSDALCDDLERLDEWGETDLRWNVLVTDHDDRLALWPGKS
jgi:hypothetical protein